MCLFVRNACCELVFEVCCWVGNCGSSRELQPCWESPQILTLQHFSCVSAGSGSLRSCWESGVEVQLYRFYFICILSWALRGFCRGWASCILILIWAMYCYFLFKYKFHPLFDKDVTTLVRNVQNSITTQEEFKKGTINVWQYDQIQCFTKWYQLYNTGYCKIKSDRYSMVKYDVLHNVLLLVWIITFIKTNMK